MIGPEWVLKSGPLWFLIGLGLKSMYRLGKAMYQMLAATSVRNVNVHRVSPEAYVAACLNYELPDHGVREALKTLDTPYGSAAAWVQSPLSVSTGRFREEVVKTLLKYIHTNNNPAISWQFRALGYSPSDIPKAVGIVSSIFTCKGRETQGPELPPKQYVKDPFAVLTEVFSKVNTSCREAGEPEFLVGADCEMLFSQAWGDVALDTGDGWWSYMWGCSNPESTNPERVFEEATKVAKSIRSANTNYGRLTQKDQELLRKNAHLPIKELATMLEKTDAKIRKELEKMRGEGWV